PPAGGRTGSANRRRPKANRRCGKANARCRKADRRSGTATGHAQEEFHQFFQASFLRRPGRHTTPPLLAEEEEWAQTGRATRARGTGTATRGEAGSNRRGLAVAMQALRNRVATGPGGAADNRGCPLPSDCGFAGSDPARGHRIPVSEAGVSLLPERDPRRGAFRTRPRDRGAPDGGGQLSDLGAEDDAARRAGHPAGPLRRGDQRGQRAEGVGGDGRCGGSALHGIGGGPGYRAGVKQRRNRQPYQRRQTLGLGVVLLVVCVLPHRLQSGRGGAGGVAGEAFAGILCSDRCPTYLSYHRGLAQFCWAHLQRTLKGIGEFASTADAVHFARDMLSAVKRLFGLWYQFRGEAGAGKRLLTRTELIQQSIPIQKRICRLAAKYMDSDDREVRNLASAFYVHWDKLFTFIEHEGVEPTNNVSDGAMPVFVLIRKIAYGTRSPKGENALARLLTVTQTCKLQQRPLLSYLLTAVHCHRRRQPAPSLRPLQSQQP